MKQHQQAIGRCDEWLTPPELLRALGQFDLDPCAPVESCRPWPTAERHFTVENDGLSRAWSGRVWCNPPFNRVERPKWMQAMAVHANGIMLIPAATETEAFFLHVWNKASAVCFVRGRPHFHFTDGSRAAFNCGTAIALVAYGPRNAEILCAAELGKTVLLPAP